MWLEALLTSADIEQVLLELTPVRIELDPSRSDRFLWLGAPSSVVLVADQGIRILTRARLQWDVVGLTVPILVEEVAVMLLPSIRQQADRDVLQLELRIDRLDLSMVPSVVESAVLERLNALLTRPEAALIWRFMDTLDFEFGVPRSIRPLDMLRLRAQFGQVRITEAGLSLAVAFGLEARRDEKFAEQPPPSLSFDRRRPPERSVEAPSR